MQDAKNALAYLNLGMAGFVMAAIAVRFQYAQISGEGRAFWMLRTAPIDPERYLWAKALPGLVPMLIVGGAITVATNAILNSPPLLFAISAFTGIGFAFGLSGIAVGMGALTPDFKADNVARAASGPGAIVFMVAALSLVFSVVASLSVPVFFILRNDRDGLPLSPGEWALALGFFLLAAVLCVVGTVLPVRKAAPGLWGRNL
jgi:ABC-2 type transport system permease protein